jgi:hypothetical protein
MIPRDKHLDVIKAMFPRQYECIEMLYEEDDDFRALCLDYLFCIQRLQKLKKELHEKQVSVKEFSDAEIELTKELMTFLFQDGHKKH